MRGERKPAQQRAKMLLRVLGLAVDEVFNALADIGTDCTSIAIELEAFDHRVGKVSWEQRLSDFGIKKELR